MRARGYSLPFVIMILLLLSVTLASLLFVLNAGARSTESMLGRRKLFYACDGLSRIAAVSAQNYFATTATPDSTGLRDFICTEGGNCTGCTADGCTGGLGTFSSQTPGFSVNSFNIANLGNRRIAPLDSGPFEGMIAMQDSVDLRLGAQKNGAGWKCDVTQELSLGKIAMFQFFVFSDLPYTDWSPGPPMSGTGRVHANGDICFWGGDGPLYVERVTASGKIESDAADCFAGSDANNLSGACIQVDNTPFPATLSNTCPAGFVKFTVRDNNDSTWATIANRVPTGGQPYGFNKRLQDRAHKVPELKLPVFGSPLVQSGVDARNSNVMSNSNTSRLLVDPVFGDDTTDVVDQKFAKRADIRILDGVWYLRPETGVDNWPGTPIWSDHPGRYTTPTAGIEGYVPGSKAVGQLDIAAAFTWTAVPVRYSYYTFSGAGALNRTATDPTAVISYGVLARDTGGATTWRPGYRCDAGNVVDALNVAVNCAAPAVTNIATRLLNGTRSGLRNGMAQMAFGTGDLTLSNYLPMNFDVAAFQNALMSTSAHELGSHFPGTVNGGTGRKFNGIVWIGSSWPGQMAGRTSGTPSAPPPQGTIGGANGIHRQVALPYELCSRSGSGQLAGTTIPTTTQAIPDCASYDGGGPLQNARPTAVRIFNARHLNVETTPAAGRPALTFTASTTNKPLLNGAGKNGLTIATNITTYLMGDANLSSDPAIPVPLPNPPPHWVPFLVAGDVVHLLSNNWDDGLSRWGSAYAADQGALSRVATNTTYNFEMLSGWSLTANQANKFSGGLHNFPRFQEEWGGVTARIRGSLVAGWYPVLTRWPWTCCDDRDYRAPNRDWGFDSHLESILNQPPGAPLYDVQSTRRWKR
jgi:hypothetical protein